MGYEQLSFSSFIKEVKEATNGAHPRKFCFVLGAGASRSSGIKSGQELVKIWDTQLQERNEAEYRRWRSELKITDENMSEHYSEYYEKRYSHCPTDGYNYLEKLMESAKPYVGYIMLAHLLTTTPHNVVITTNFDHLAEDAVSYYSHATPLVAGHESLARYVTGQPVRPTIIKIHRDLLFDPKNKTSELEALSDGWKDALARIFEHYHPIFVGYAGNDQSLMDFLVKNSSKFENGTWKFPYWLLYKTDPVSGKIEEYLNASNGYSVKHSGFDDVMISLGKAFDYKLPNEEIFLKDAKARFTALTDALTKFTAPSSSGETESPASADEKNPPVPTHPIPADDDEATVEEAKDDIANQLDLHQMFSQALDLSRDGKFHAAIKIAKELITINPSSDNYHWLYGTVLERQGDVQNALSEFQKAAALDPDDATNHYCVSNALLSLGRPLEALSAVNTAIVLEPDELYHYDLLADIQDALGNKNEADIAREKAGRIEYI